MNALIAILLPFAAMIAVAILMIGLGSVFLAAGHNGTIVIGLAIIVLVPAAGWLLARGGDSSTSG